MAATIEAVAPGRFGLNIVSGWFKDEFDQMGLWPGDEHFSSRYDYADEYVTILRDLWSTGRSDFKGRYFTMNEAEIKPLPSTYIPLVCAGQSERGIRFTAEKGDSNFVIAGGNVGDIDADIAKFREITSALQAQAKLLGRNVSTIALFNVIAAETDADAAKRFDYIVAGADEGALATMADQAELDQSDGMSASLKKKSMFMGLPTLVGSFETVAAYLDRIHDEANVGACMFAFPDFVKDLDDFGERILPCMESRKHTA